MESIIIALLLTLIVGAAIVYIVKAKKKGQTCIGCPYSGQCGECTCQGDS